jgi:4'-phosphopantetheinyl transferase
MNHTGNTPFSEIAQPPQRLPVKIPGVSLWWATLVQPEATIAQWRNWLSPEERQRAERISQPLLAHRAVAVRALLRGLLAQALGKACAPSPASLCFQTGAHGRPGLDGAFANGAVRDFNLSHSGDNLLVGIVRQSAPSSWQRIGVDLESSQPSRDIKRLARRVLCVREQATLTDLNHEERQHAFLRYWVLKEAFSKAVGAGFSMGFDSMDFDITSPTPQARTLPESYRPEDWTLQFLPIGSPFVAALALGETSGTDQNRSLTPVF